jgi:hypothetical protein
VTNPTPVTTTRLKALASPADTVSLWLARLAQVCWSM